MLHITARHAANAATLQVEVCKDVVGYGQGMWLILGKVVSHACRN
jgi:hypothetical protein